MIYLLAYLITGWIIGLSLWRIKNIEIHLRVLTGFIIFWFVLFIVYIF